jgi:hypothetical protein
VGYVLVSVMAVIVIALTWMWWSGRVGRDPQSTVASFHRALDAMQPKDRAPAPPEGSDQPDSAD